MQELNLSCDGRTMSPLLRGSKLSRDSWVPRYHTPALGTTLVFPNTTPTLNLSLQVQLGSRRGKGWDVGGCLQVLGHSREDTCSTSNSQASLCLPSRSPSALARRSHPRVFHTLLPLRPEIPSKSQRCPLTTHTIPTPRNQPQTAPPLKSSVKA